MAGYGLPNEHHLSVVLEQRLKDQGKNIKVINGSVSGSTSSGGLNRAEWSLSDEDVDLMILGLGANDMLRGIPPNETEQNLEKIIKIAQSKNIKVILAGMLAPTSHGIEYKKKFDMIYQHCAAFCTNNVMHFVAFETVIIALFHTVFRKPSGAFVAIDLFINRALLL